MLASYAPWKAPNRNGNQPNVMPEVTIAEEVAKFIQLIIVRIIPILF